MKDLKNKLTLPELFPNNDIDEQETIISWTRGDENIQIYTADNTMLTKLKKLIEAGPEQYNVVGINYVGEDPCSVTIEAPMRCLSLRAGNKKDLSDEERARLAERMRNINKK